MPSLKVLILGGGNGAHVYAGRASTNSENEVRVLTLFEDEAQRWSNTLKTSDLVIDYIDTDGTEKQYVSKPSLVTDDPKLAVPGSDIIVFVVPAFAHTRFWEAIKPYVEPGMTIIGMPGAAGWEFQAYAILGDQAKGISFLCFNTLPWACRITEYGKKVSILGFKDVIIGSMRKGSVETKCDPYAALRQTLGEIPKCKIFGDLLGMTLSYTNAMLHPGIMYARWHNWDGIPLSESPLFYHGIDQKTADFVCDLSDELISVTKKISIQKPGIDLSAVNHISDIILEHYTGNIQDKSTFLKMLCTNMAYSGLRHPVIQKDDGTVAPDFSYRYICEDIPCGLVVLRGIAEIVGVPTPNMDQLILWGQALMGKEFLVDGKIKGKDLGITRAPQRYGFTTLDAILVDL